MPATQSNRYLQNRCRYPPNLAFALQYSGVSLNSLNDKTYRSHR
ncbi:Uncharacterised protein [Serratia liquefaciens]|nr:Uncharacterised protein [Serratia liquefaciens]CAI0879888.1 Uncharacterised protein [Serratia liquefaciens]CAI0948707.1 Uncharacterised protein [Serratia liquefaciens]